MQTTTSTPTINFIDQRGTRATEAWRCALIDRRGIEVGNGYGDTQRAAYAEARENFRENRIAALKAELVDYDRAALSIR